MIPGQNHPLTPKCAALLRRHMLYLALRQCIIARVWNFSDLSLLEAQSRQIEVGNFELALELRPPLRTLLCALHLDLITDYTIFQAYYNATLALNASKKFGQMTKECEISSRVGSSQFCRRLLRLFASLAARLSRSHPKLTV